MHHDLVFGDFIDLGRKEGTTFTATISSFCRFLASLTCPYEPKPIVTWLFA